MMTLHSRSVLFEPIRSNDIEAVKSILSMERTRLRANGADFHMLRKSIKYNRRKITELLLDHGCRASLPSFVGNSPLHLVVVKSRCYPLVKRLLERGGKANQKNRWNETPIQLAFLAAAEDRVIKLLLTAHLKRSVVNEVNDVGLSYLHIACAAADLDCVRKFVEDGAADIHAQVKEDCDSPYAGSTPLHMAVEFGKSEIIAYLLEQGANVYTPDSEGSTPIHLALELGETDIIELLFEYDSARINFCNDNGLSHFMAACACSGPKIAQEFLIAKSKEDHLLITNEVVDSPENADYALKGFTPLHVAAIFGRFETAKLLLADGADCCAITHGTVTPMLFAAKYGYQEVADLINAYCHAYDWFER